MTANPWDKFFWNDWENDPALKLCSLAAQGLWMRILCICAKADPKGYLLVAGQPLTPPDVASLVGKSASEVETHMLELARYGVYSTDRTGRIYSRRMVRDVKKSRTARHNGKQGGNPSLSKGNGNPASDNPRPKGEDKPHKPSASSSEPPSLRSGGRRKGSKPKRPWAVGTSIPSDWISEAHALRAKHNLRRANLTLEADKFVNHALNTQRQCSEWQRAFNNWCISDYVKGESNGTGGKPSNLNTHLAGVAATLDREGVGDAPPADPEPRNDPGWSERGGDPAVIEGSFRAAAAGDEAGDRDGIRDAAGGLPAPGDDRGAGEYEIPAFLLRSGGAHA